MAMLEITPEVLERIREIAQLEQRPLNEVLASALMQYVPRPVPPLPEERDARRQAALRRVRDGVYEQARRYWSEVGNETRLALTDAELDEQFWLIDHEGIPRLKSDRGAVEVHPGSLAALAQSARKVAFHSGQSDIAARSREILETEFAEYLLGRLHGEQE